MAEINWGILQPVDTGAQVQQGFATGMALVKGQQTKAALAHYLQNPDDPQAYSALAYLDPQQAQVAETEHRQRLADQAAQSQMALRRTAGAAAASGDIQGGMSAALSGGDLEFANALSKMDDDQKKKVADMYKGAAPLAYQALKLPYAQRRAYIENVRPQLEAAGWDSAKIDAFDPSDANLGGIVQANMTLDQALARDKVEYREVMPGARLVPFDSTGRPLTADTGAVATTAPVQTPAVRTTGNAPAKNNPGALRVPGSMRFQSFATPQEGIQAQEALLGRYMQRGLNSVSSIVETYAPRQSKGGDNTDAQVDNYIGHVAQRLGVDPHAPLSPAVVPQLAAAMREFETGKRAAPAATDPSEIRLNAVAAIAAGADPVAVHKRAQQMGVTL